MIPEYKLYHGAFLAELIQRMAQPLLVDELAEPGRLSSYIINEDVGVQVKHSAQRMHPWPFTFTRSNLDEHDTLTSRCKDTFIVFVCHTDGMVCVPLHEMQSVLEIGESDQAWARIDRRKREWYCISGGKGELASKKPRGLDILINCLDGQVLPTERALEAESMLQTKERSRFSFFSLEKFR
jgi:hypothetical protein